MAAEFRHERFQHHRTFTLGESLASQALSPDGMCLVTGSRKGGLVKLWNTHTGQLDRAWTAVPLSPYPYINETSIEYGITALAISPDGGTLVVGGKALKTWELKTGKPIRAFKGFGSRVSYATVSTDAQILLTDGTVGIRRAMNVWSLSSGKKIRRSLSAAGWVISPDSKMIVGFEMEECGDSPRPVKVWDLMTGEILRHLDNRYAIRAQQFTFSPDGKLLAGSGFDGIKIWNFETGEQIQRVEKYRNVQFHEHLDRVHTIIFSPDRKSLLSTGSDGSIQIWDVEAGTNVGALQSEARLGWIGMSINGQTIVGVGGAGQNSNIVEVWISSLTNAN